MHTAIGTVPSELQTGFLNLLPRVERHARIAFRSVKCPQTRDDAVAEMVAVAWHCYVKATEAGKDLGQFPGAFATLLALHVRSGRRLCGQEPARDVMSRRAQYRHGFCLDTLPAADELGGPLLAEERHPGTQRSVVDLVQPRVDIPGWLASLPVRRRLLVEDLIQDKRVTDIASRHGVSPARVSQIRKELKADWERFCGDGEPRTPVV